MALRVLEGATMLLRVVFMLPIAACSVSEQRTARVPHIDVPLTSGQPMDTRYELAAGLANVTDVIAPKVGDHTQSIEVPGTQMRDEVRERVSPRGQFGFVYERGFGGTTERPDSSQTPVGPGDVTGYGMSFGWSFRTDTPGLSIGTTYELIAWKVPVVESAICHTNDFDCTPGSVVVSHGRQLAGTLGLGVQPSYRTGNLTLFGGAFARNHPTTPATKELLFGARTAYIDHGPINLLLDAGVEYRVAPRLSALLLVHQDITASPLRYGPGIGFALTAKLGDRF